MKIVIWSTWILCICCLGVLIFLIYHKYKIEKCDNQTTATIIKLEKESYNAGNRTKFFYKLIYRYTVSGIVYEERDVCDSTEPQKYEKGQVVLISYETKNPKNFIVSSEIKSINIDIIRTFFVLVVCIGVALVATYYLS